MPAAHIKLRITDLETYLEVTAPLSATHRKQKGAITYFFQNWEPLENNLPATKKTTR